MSVRKPRSNLHEIFSKIEIYSVRLAALILLLIKLGQMVIPEIRNLFK